MSSSAEILFPSESQILNEVEKTIANVLPSIAKSSLPPGSANLNKSKKKSPQKEKQSIPIKSNPTQPTPQIEKKLIKKSKSIEKKLDENIENQLTSLKKTRLTSHRMVLNLTAQYTLEQKLSFYKSLLVAAPAIQMSIADEATNSRKLLKIPCEEKTKKLSYKEAKKKIEQDLEEEKKKNESPNAVSKYAELWKNINAFDSQKQMYLDQKCVHEMLQALKDSNEKANLHVKLDKYLLGKFLYKCCGYYCNSNNIKFNVAEFLNYFQLQSDKHYELKRVYEWINWYALISNCPYVIHVQRMTYTDFSGPIIRQIINETDKEFRALVRTDSKAILLPSFTFPSIKAEEIPLVGSSKKKNENDESESEEDYEENEDQNEDEDNVDMADLSITS